MMRRRTATTGLLLGLLSSCAKPKPKIIGVQVPVLPDMSGMNVSPDAPAVQLPAAAPLADWPQQLANTAHVPGNVAAPLGFKPRWRADIGASGGYRQPLMASPLIVGGHVFTMDADAAVRALSLAQGKDLWRTVTRPKHATEQNIGGGIAYDSGKIYASTGYGELLALDATSGKILWRQKLGLAARSAPLVAAGLVAVLIQNDQLLTFDAASGTPGWHFSGAVGQPSTTAMSICGAPAYADGIIVAGFSTGVLAAINASSGMPVWEQSLSASAGGSSSVDFSDIVAAPVIADGVVYATNLGDTAMAVDLHSGAKVWTHGATSTQAMCLSGGFAFLLDTSQKLYAIHADDGLVRWAAQMPAFRNVKHQSGPTQDWAGPLLVNGMLMLVSNLGNAALVDPETGKLKHMKNLGGWLDMPPVAAGGVLLTLARDATLTAYG